MDSTEELEARWPSLADQQKIYRAYRNDSDAGKDGRPKPKVFYRRSPPNDLLGISVGLTIEGAIENLTPCGLCVIEVGHARAQSKDLVIVDVIQDQSTHANITGVPLLRDDEENALRIARDLARSAEREPLPAKQ